MDIKVYNIAHWDFFLHKGSCFESTINMKKAFRQ